MDTTAADTTAADTTAADTGVLDTTAADTTAADTTAADTTAADTTAADTTALDTMPGSDTVGSLADADGSSVEDGSSGLPADHASELAPITYEIEPFSLLVDFPWGAELVEAFVADGDIRIQGDIVVARRDELIDDKGAFYKSVATPKLGRRWPNSRLAYDFASDFDDRERVERALRLMRLLTPVQFVPYTDQSHRLHFKNADGSSSPIGRRERRQEVKVSAAASHYNIAHEVLHSLGFYHEQSRPDRDTYVRYDSSCVKLLDRHNFNKHGSALILGPYDYGSVMHYPKSGLCRRDSADNCHCYPLTLREDVAPEGTTIGQRSRLSQLDIDGVHRLYGTLRAASGDNERFGSVMVSGDFDGDGTDDLAVGTPGDSVGSALDVGAVHVFKGTLAGLVPWKTLTPASSNELGGPLGARTGGARFGAALAVGDFDGDGTDDLAVGAPGATVDGRDEAGQVYVFRAEPLPEDLVTPPRTTVALVPWRRLSRADSEATVAAGDQFGAALAAGDSTGDGISELFVGAPGALDDGVASGVVVAFRGSEDALTWLWDLMPPADDYASARTAFGAAVACGDLDQDGRADVAVGAPGAVVVDVDPISGATVYIDSGAVDVFRSRGQTFTHHVRLDQRNLEQNLKGDGFGAVLAIGRGIHDARAILVVGAPDDYAGGVFTFRGATEGGGAISAWRYVTQDGLDTTENGDRFGAAIALGDWTGDGWIDLAVGATGEAYGASSAATGRAYLYRGADDGHHASGELGQVGLSTDEPGDDFGAALAWGDFNGDQAMDLAIGASGETLSSGGNIHDRTGAAYVFRHATVLSPSQALDQETPAPEGEDSED